MGEKFHEEKWRHGICDCGDCGTCMAAWCCNPCILGRSAYRLEHFPNPDMANFSYLNLFCALSFAANTLGVQCLPVWLKRSEARERFGIEGDFCTDCLASCCCTCCAAAQLEVELKDRAESQPMMQAYKSQNNGMTYQAPAEPRNYYNGGLPVR